MDELVAIAGWHAPAHDDGLLPDPRLDLVSKVKRGVDGLGRGGGEERARVDEHHIGTRNVLALAIARLVEERPHTIRVDFVLGAPEGDVKAIWHFPTCSSRTEGAGRSRLRATPR